MTTAITGSIGLMRPSQPREARSEKPAQKIATTNSTSKSARRSDQAKALNTVRKNSSPVRSLIGTDKGPGLTTQMRCASSAK